MNYNLTFWQRLELIPMRILWLLADPSERKSWHEVKKGMEPHRHRYTKDFYYNGRWEGFMCDHEGCNLVTPKEFIHELDGEGYGPTEK